MYREITEKLCCPICRNPLILHEGETQNDEVISGKLRCSHGHEFFIRQGIVDFCAQEQTNINTWSEYYEKEDYEALDRKLDAVKSENQKRIEEKFLTGITEETGKLQKGFLLDIASGRGVLLRQLLKSCHTDVHIISADLSFDVLKYDRLKLKTVAPTVKVSYLTCDCTQLPIKDDCLDGVCTFVGIVNMLHLAEKGIGEAARVLKPGASLINSCIYMDSHTPGFKNVSKVLRENGSPGAEKILIKEDLLDIHKKYFASLEEKIMYDGIAGNSPNDLIPCAGEWFADVVLIAKKGTENME